MSADYVWPRGVLDPLGPRCEAITTPTDRRMLWHLRSMLAVSGTTDLHHGIGRALGKYLAETCEHHWTDSPATEDDPEPYGWPGGFRQCLWCDDVQARAAGATR